MRLPIKLKIFLGLTTILLLVLGLNLYFSSQLFIKDKTNYVYESSLQRLEDLSYQFQSPINQTFANLRPYILLANDNKEQFNSVYNSNTSILFFSYKVDNKWKSFPKDKHKHLSTWFESNKSTIQLKEKSQIKGIVIDKKPHILLTLALDNFSIVSVLDYSYFQELTGAGKLFKYNLLTGNGLPFASKDKRSLSYLSSIFKSNSAQGTKKLIKNKEDILVSYVKIPQFNMVLTSEIRSRDAFKASEELISRSFFIGMIILGVSIIVSLIFSSRLTKPIKILHTATQSFAEGNFTNKVVINTNDELRNLGDAFNAMASQIGKLLEEQKEMILKLEDYNQNLEQKVNERTEELQKANKFIEAMINSLNQGLLVFDEKQAIADTFTNSCNDIFNSEVEGKKYSDLLELNEKDSNVLQKGVDLIFSNKLPFSSASNLIKKNKITGESIDDDKFKHVSLEYFPLKNGPIDENEEETISHIVVVATDKTDEVKAVQAFKEKESYVNMITKLVSNKKQFMNFIADIKKSLQTISSELENDKPNYNSILMQYHTINGGAGTYSAQSLQKKARASEQTIIDSKDKDDYQMDLIFNDFSSVTDEFKKLEENINLVLGANKDTIEINKSEIEILKDKLQGHIPEDLYNEYLNQFCFEPVSAYIEEYISLVQMIAEKTNKNIKPLMITGGNTRIPGDGVERFFNSLVHLFRNCVDHGIETPSTREENEKSSEGTIAIDINKDKDNFLCILVTDDGAGINPERIRQKWEELHGDNELIKDLSDEEVIYKIFDPTFSTTEELSEFSGRGVGMSAIKETIDELGGELSLSSVVGQGTKFTFKLPLSSIV
jgi:two-component system chemotaxis sensor kinase CheA